MPSVFAPWEATHPANISRFSAATNKGKCIFFNRTPIPRVVCTPNGVHAPATIAALEAGCHVMVEKPMAMNPSECQKMCNAAEKAGKILAVGFQYRDHPSTEMCLRAFQEGYARSSLLPPERLRNLWDALWETLERGAHVEYNLPRSCQGEDLKFLRTHLH